MGMVAQAKFSRFANMPPKVLLPILWKIPDRRPDAERGRSYKSCKNEECGNKGRRGKKFQGYCPQCALEANLGRCGKEGCNQQVRDGGGGYCRAHGASKRACEEEGCNSVPWARGYCRKHQRRSVGSQEALGDEKVEAAEEAAATAAKEDAKEHNLGHCREEGHKRYGKVMGALVRVCDEEGCNTMRGFCKKHPIRRRFGSQVDLGDEEVEAAEEAAATAAEEDEVAMRDEPDEMATHGEAVRMPATWFDVSPCMPPGTQLHVAEETVCIQRVLVKRQSFRWGPPPEPLADEEEESEFDSEVEDVTDEYWEEMQKVGDRMIRSGDEKKARLKQAN